jgi:hypothetical protein
LEILRLPEPPREEKERVETERRETETKERLEAERRQKSRRSLGSPPILEKQERLDHLAPSASPAERKRRPVLGIMRLLTIVICLAVGATFYYGSQRPWSIRPGELTGDKIRFALKKSLAKQNNDPNADVYKQILINQGLDPAKIPGQTFATKVYEAYKSNPNKRQAIGEAVSNLLQ